MYDIYIYIHMYTIVDGIGKHLGTPGDTQINQFCYVQIPVMSRASRPKLRWAFSAAADHS